MQPLFAILAAALFAAALLWPRRGLLARWHRARSRARRAFIEDALKHIHARELRGTLATAESLAGKLQVSVKQALDSMSEMEERGLTQSTGPGLRLTAAGRKAAIRVIRAHPLFDAFQPGSKIL